MKINLIRLILCGSAIAVCCVACAGHRPFNKGSNLRHSDPPVLHGYIRDADGNPLSGVKIRTWTGADTWFPTEDISLTDSEGYYSFHHRNASRRPNGFWSGPYYLTFEYEKIKMEGGFLDMIHVQGSGVKVRRDLCVTHEGRVVSKEMGQ